MILLEDNAHDIVGKACRGLGWTVEKLSSVAGLPAPVVRQALDGNDPRSVADEAWSALARALGLDSPALLGIVHGRHQPQVVLPGQVVRVPSLYGGGMEVNAWVLGSDGPGPALIIDTGTDGAAIAEVLGAREWKAAALFLTHDHPDHVAALAELKRRFPALAVHAPALDAVSGAKLFEPPCDLEIGGFLIRCLPTPGHTDGSTSFRVDLPTGPVCFTGDAVFAGSIGGPRFSFEAAKRSLREQIIGLPPATLICPGHGPASSIALEIHQNPFLVPLTQDTTSHP